MRKAITQVIIRKYLIGAIYTIPGCDRSVKGVVRITIGQGASVVTMADFSTAPLPVIILKLLTIALAE